MIFKIIIWKTNVKRNRAQKYFNVLQYTVFHFINFIFKDLRTFIFMLLCKMNLIIQILSEGYIQFAMKCFQTI